MKRLIVLLSLSTCFTFGFTNCNKKCASANPTCEETVPNEACMAHFNRWFYNADKNKCELISYSGCSAKGFETLDDCKACECN
nr:BPTI/Kunitz domain-containing protein [uncultured Brumimicrobium sp.]